jgi:hypothetical protein
MVAGGEGVGWLLDGRDGERIQMRLCILLETEGFVTQQCTMQFVSMAHLPVLAKQERIACTVRL